MAGFGHGPAGAKEQEDAAVSARNARNGLRLFTIYFAVYAVFVAINAFWPDEMSRTFGGISLAVVFGLGLIVLAFVLALVYAWLCRAAAGSPAEKPRGGGRP